jgi:hypothetical protein
LALFSATDTSADAFPDEHGTVMGSPETARPASPFAEKVQVVALVTTPDRVAGPPVHDTGDGLT